MSGLAILSIAVLGKHGNPLFLESYSNRRGGQADLKWHYAAHTALDFFEERGASSLMLMVHAAPHTHPHLVSSQQMRLRTRPPTRTSVCCTPWRTMLCMPSYHPSTFVTWQLTRCRSQLRLSNQHSHQICPCDRARRRSHPRHRRAHGTCRKVCTRQLPIKSSRTHELIRFTCRSSEPSTTPISASSRTRSRRWMQKRRPGSMLR